MVINVPAIPLKKDFYAKQGDSFNSGPQQFLRGGTPVDLTNATGKCQIRSAPGSGVIAELLVVIDNALECRYHLEQTKEIMATIPAPDSPYTEYYQEVEFTWTSGYRETFTAGILYLSPEVTK